MVTPPIDERPDAAARREAIAAADDRYGDHSVRLLAHLADRVEIDDHGAGDEYWRSYRFVVETADVEYTLDWDVADGWDGPTDISECLAKLVAERDSAIAASETDRLCGIERLRDVRARLKEAMARVEEWGTKETEQRVRAARALAELAAAEDERDCGRWWLAGLTLVVHGLGEQIKQERSPAFRLLRTSLPWAQIADRLNAMRKRIADDVATEIALQELDATIALVRFWQPPTEEGTNR